MLRQLRLPAIPGVLRHRDFRLLWLGSSASVVGDRLVTVALALFVVEETGSATDLGLVLAAYNVPLIALLLLGGVVADRLPRHLLVVATDLARFALHGLLAVLILAGDVRIWHLVAIGLLFGAAEAIFRPAATGLLPQTVPEDEIQEANALTAMADNVAHLAGPALATALVLGAGAGAAFALDALTFLVSAALLVRLRPRRREAARAADPAPRATAWRDVREGFEEVRSRSWVWVTLVAFCVATCCALAPLFVVGPLVAAGQYGETAVFGLVLATFGAGMVAGSLAALCVRPRRPLRRGLTFMLAWPVAIGLYAVGAPLAIVVPAMACAGAGAAMFDVWWLTALAERVPPDRLSRVAAYDWMVSLGLMPAGFLLAGPLAAAVGASEVLLGGAAVALVMLALALVPRETRALGRLDGAPAAFPAAEAAASASRA